MTEGVYRFLIHSYIFILFQLRLLNLNTLNNDTCWDEKLA
jgi:hypothetical protein